MAAFVLRAESGPDAGRVFPIDPAGAVIGRQADADIVLDDDQTSRHHARLVPGDGGLLISDLGSANGTHVNGQPLTTPLVLVPGDLIEIGASHLRLERADPAPGPGADATRVAPQLAAPAASPPFAGVGNRPPAMVPPAAVTPARAGAGSRLPLVIGGIVGALLLLCVCGGLGVALLARAGGPDATPTEASGPGIGGQPGFAPIVPTAAGIGGAGGQTASPATGRYECYSFSGGRLVPQGNLNFTIAGGGRYTDVGGKSGTFTYDPGSQVITFRKAALDGQRAQYDGTHTPSSITFLTAQGDLGDSCDNQP